MQKIVFFLLILASACNGTETTASASKPTSGAALGPEFSFYELEAVAGSNAQIARHINDAGHLISIGLIENGKKQGGWMYYADGKFSPVKVENYLDGVLHGAYLEIDQVGRLVKSAYYVHGKLEGGYAEFRASHPQLTATYKNGQLHGTLRSHTLQNGKINQSVAYKNGLQDGPMRWYNEQEELIQERIYKDGKLVE